MTRLPALAVMHWPARLEAASRDRGAAVAERSDRAAVGRAIAPGCHSSAVRAGKAPHATWDTRVALAMPLRGAPRRDFEETAAGVPHQRAGSEGPRLAP